MKLIIIISLLFIQFESTAQNYLGDFSHKEEDHYWTRSGEKIFGQFGVKYKNAVTKNATIEVYLKDDSGNFIEIDEIESLVIGADSFIVAQDFVLNGVTIYDKDLVKVIKVGKINLYEHCREVVDILSFNLILPNTYYKYSYVIQKYGDSVFYRITSKNQFKKYFLSMVENDEKLVTKILATKKKWWLIDIPDFVEEYNNN